MSSSASASASVTGSSAESLVPSASPSSVATVEPYREDEATLARLFPPHAPLPAPPAEDFEAHPRRYLMLLQGQEGFGAWNDQIWEMLDLARSLNRSFVEPCVRNSCLEPCRCGAVVPVPVGDGELGQFEAGLDPLDLPWIDYPCEPDTDGMKRFVGAAYPLSAYLDLAVLRAYYPHIVPYQAWCERVAPASFNETSRDGRWVVRGGSYCGELQLHWCELRAHAVFPKVIGDFQLVKPVWGRPGVDASDEASIMGTLSADASTTLFYFGYYRGYFPSPRRGHNVPFHPGHHRAVQAWIRAHFGTAPLTALHWRSEHVDADMLEPCAEQLAGVLDALAWPPTPSGARGVLLADMPAPNNVHLMWHTYESSNDTSRHGAMATLMRGAGGGEGGAGGGGGGGGSGGGGGGRLLKYDEVHNNTDTGVLMIRDFLIGVYADSYITCQGDFVEDCNGCFRSNSNFVQRLMAVRKEHERSSHQRWFAIDQRDVPRAPLGPRRLEGIRGA